MGIADVTGERGSRIVEAHSMSTAIRHAQVRKISSRDGHVVIVVVICLSVVVLSTASR